jgi:uncharacterized protein with HEPN domain
MKESKKDPMLFLIHVSTSIDKVETFLRGVTREKFFKDELRKSAVTRELEVIGEAVKNLPMDFYVKYPHVEWKDIAGTRDKIVHHYFGVDFDIIWNIAKKDLPLLKKDILEIIEKENAKKSK